MRYIMQAFAVFLVFGMVSAGISVTNYTISKSSFGPGDEGVITLTVGNPMISNTVGYRMTGVAVSYFPPPELTTSGVTNIGDIDAGGSTIVSIPIRVSKTAKSGIYLFEIKLTGYSASTATTGQDVYAKTVSIPVIVASQPIITFVPDRAVIGGIDTVRFNITNNGGTAKNLRIKAPATSSVVLYGVDEIYVSALAGASVLALTLDSRNATDGPFSLPLELAYDDEIGVSHTETDYIRMTVRKEAVLS